MSAPGVRSRGPAAFTCLTRYRLTVRAAVAAKKACSSREQPVEASYATAVEAACR